MTEYIKRDDVMNLVKQGKLVSNRNYESVCAYINSVPSADVVERKKGEWIRVIEELGELWMCSECMEEFIPHDGMEEFASYAHFCPNCGAEMVR